jgi:hypothetical protein
MPHLNPALRKRPKYGHLEGLAKLGCFCEMVASLNLYFHRLGFLTHCFTWPLVSMVKLYQQVLLASQPKFPTIV